MKKKYNSNISSFNINFMHFIVFRLEKGTFVFVFYWLVGWSKTRTKPSTSMRAEHDWYMRGDKYAAKASGGPIMYGLLKEKHLAHLR